MLKQVPSSQAQLPLAKRFLPKPPPKPPKPKLLWVVFGGDGRVTGFTKNYDAVQALRGYEVTRNVSLGDQAHAKRRSEFPSYVDIQPGMTKEECHGQQPIGRPSQSRP